MLIPIFHICVLYILFFSFMFFSHVIRLGKIFGIQIKIDISWFIVFFLVVFSLQGMYSSQEVYFDFLPKFLQWCVSIITALLIFCSVLLHELAHSYVAIKEGIIMRGITLFVFGGVAETTQEPETASSELKIAIVGPITSILIALLCWLLSTQEIVPIYGFIGAISRLILKTVRDVNFFVVAFNLLPGFPLDGGRLFRAFLWKITGNLRKATRIAAGAGEFFGFLLIFGGFFLIFLFPRNFINGLWLAFIGWFLHQAAENSYKQLLFRQALYGLKVEDVMTPEVISIDPSISLADLVNNYFLKYRYSIFPVVLSDIFQGCISLSEVKKYPQEKWAYIKVGEAMTTEKERYIIDAATDAATALSKMLREEMGNLIVTKANQIIGIITLSDLMTLFKIKSDLLLGKQ